MRGCCEVVKKLSYIAHNDKSPVQFWTSQPYITNCPCVGISALIFCGNAFIGIICQISNPKKIAFFYLRNILIKSSIDLINPTNMTENFEKTYYCLAPDGTLRTRVTTIRFSPSQKVTKFETNLGTERDYLDAVTVEFLRGTYICKDPMIAEYLDIYTTGGLFQGRYYEPNTWGFTVTDKDPSQLVQVKEVERQTVVEVVKYPISFIESQNVKNLEQLCIASGISLDGVTPGKATYIDILRSNGFIKE